MFVIIGATALCGYDKMSGDNVMVCYGLVGAGYGLANVLEKKNDKA
jgi:hypothetical protein